jgi:zinc and cadmium transporter
MVLAYILIFTFLGSIASLVGSFFLLIKRQLTQSFTDKIVNFAAGVLIAVALLDLLPAAQESAGAKNIFMPTLVGFVIFFFAERFLQWFHRHHEHGQRASVLLILVGDGVHNFIDGVAIAASFLTSIPLGITTSLAVAAHEIPQEIADMSVLLTSGLSKSRALFSLETTFIFFCRQLQASLYTSRQVILSPVFMKNIWRIENSLILSFSCWEF